MLFSLSPYTLTLNSAVILSSPVVFQRIRIWPFGPGAVCLDETSPLVSRAPVEVALRVIAVMYHMTPEPIPLSGEKELSPIGH